MQSASDRNAYQTWNPPADLVSDFKAGNNAIEARTLQYLPTNTVIPPINKDSVSNRMTFQIPTSGAIDTKSLRVYLTMELVVDANTGTTGWIRLDNAGWSSMIHSINVYENNQVIEQINSASILAAMCIHNTPEDYQEGVLGITEHTQFYEDDASQYGVDLLLPRGKPGGKTLIAFNGGNTDLVGTADLLPVKATFSTSLNLPIGLFNTNRPLFSYLYRPMTIEILFHGWTNFLVFSGSAGAAAGSIANATGFQKLIHTSVNATTFKITDAQLRYDLLSLSPEFKQMQMSAIQEMAGGFFEYPYNSYKVTELQLTDNTRQVMKISGTAGTTLESVMFGFLQFPSNDPSSPSQSMFSSLGLESYYFMVGGIRKPMQDIKVLEGSGTTGLPWATSSAGAAVAVNYDESEGYVELTKAQGMYKSYSVGMKGASLHLVNSKVIPTAAVDASVTAIVGKNRRVFSYSFQTAFDQEVTSGLVLADNSEISLVLNFKAVIAARAGTRMYVALNYAQKLLTNGKDVYNQM